MKNYCKNKGCHSCAIKVSSESGYCDVCYYKNLLFNLLCVIHRDGGQYIIIHGVDIAVDDAEKRIVVFKESFDKENKL